MWWLLLVYSVEGYSADTVYRTLDQCMEQKAEQDLCVEVVVQFALWPERGPTS